MAGGGFGYHEEHTEAHAVILNIETKQLVGALEIEASGTMSGAIVLVLVVTVDPMTASSACSGLGSAVAKHLPAGNAELPNRVVTLPAFGLDVVFDTPQGIKKREDLAKLEEMEKRAEELERLKVRALDGDVEARKQIEEIEVRASRGEGTAQLEMAILGPMFSDRKARILQFCHAVHQGQKRATLDLAHYYWYGNAPYDPDRVRGYMWHLIASSKGVEGATSKLTRRSPTPCEVEAEMGVAGG
jgi:hypothetical protein